ncbi:hypothetical protein C1H76_0371 [Elsinoe australis]|uniref:Uncharacterized protein n=1 Tax=Elsinoe australis TaxID=40998 RepID=A0A4U7B7Q7_9PEZI|nr:hypothetical protein C1H76_0371 [Elsinoe australis]
MAPITTSTSTSIGSPSLVFGTLPDNLHINRPTLGLSHTSANVASTSSAQQQGHIPGSSGANSSKTDRGLQPTSHHDEVVDELLASLIELQREVVLLKTVIKEDKSQIAEHEKQERLYEDRLTEVEREMHRAKADLRHSLKYVDRMQEHRDRDVDRTVDLKREIARLRDESGLHARIETLEAENRKSAEEKERHRQFAYDAQAKLTFVAGSVAAMAESNAVMAARLKQLELLLPQEVLDANPPVIPSWMSPPEGTQLPAEPVDAGNPAAPATPDAPPQPQRLPDHVLRADVPDFTPACFLPSMAARLPERPRSSPSTSPVCTAGPASRIVPLPRRPGSPSPDVSSPDDPGSSDQDALPAPTSSPVTSPSPQAGSSPSETPQPASTSQDKEVTTRPPLPGDSWAMDEPAGFGGKRSRDKKRATDGRREGAYKGEMAWRRGLDEERIGERRDKGKGRARAKREKGKAGRK